MKIKVRKRVDLYLEEEIYDELQRVATIAKTDCATVIMILLAMKFPKQTKPKPRR